MAIFRSFSEIVNSIIERLRLTQPNLDTKPGTVARDVFIDLPADQIERLHSSLVVVSDKQSPETAAGRDLERWANNFKIPKRPASPANGVVVFTTSNLTSDIPIPSGSLVTAKNGIQFRTVGNYLMSVAEKSRFSATANRLRAALNVAGITDSFAIEVPVRATRAGTQGNIASLQIISNNLEDALTVTNLTTFRDGSNIESDAAFKARVFAIFSGANTGTASGYRNAALSISGVNDAIIVEPGSSLMLRDGTETIEINDGSFRILNSGTGGKVDIYILGKQLEEVVESFIFTDKSGSGNATDERNDIILGQNNLDSTLTSDERRLKAFSTGNIPMQPVNTIISLIGSKSGVLALKSTNSDGEVSGSFELIKDFNVETGGSPFGFDKIRFISNSKTVESENIIKKSINSVDPLRFSDVTELKQVYQHIAISGENAKVSSAERNVIQLNHAPVVSASRVVNKTTGEVYVIESQNLNSSTGLNETGELTISGKTLPTSADILSVDYTWRMIFDPYIDYNGIDIPALFTDESINDSIDWGTSNGIFSETAIITKTTDGLEFQVELEQTVSRVISVFSAITTTGTISDVENIDGISVPGIVLGSSDSSIDNIISITTSNGVELYYTQDEDGTFSGKTIVLPSDSPIDDATIVTVFYNKIELFDISNGDGSNSNKTITLPSEDILDASELLDEVEDLYLTGETVYVKYIAEINDIVPSISLSSLPINGTTTSNILLNSSLTQIASSNQPIFYEFGSSSAPSKIERFGPTRLALTTSGTTKAGKIKVLGETLTRLEVEVLAGLSLTGLTFDLSAVIKDILDVTTLPTNIGIARVDKIESLDNPDTEFDLVGQKLKKISYSFGTADLDSTLSATKFTLPATEANNSLDLSSAEKLKINFLLYNTSDAEDAFFSGNGLVITDKVFARIDRISVSSGFRSVTNAMVGSLLIQPFNQPGVGLSYSANYTFIAPKEGERLTARYNLNRLITDVTINVEKVRSITADVLVKESPILEVDVSGEIIVNANLSRESNTVVENAISAVINLLNSQTLGGTVDYSDLINSVTSITGVDSVNISLFEESGKTGRRSFIKSLDNQSIAAGAISFKAIARKDFRIT